MAHVRQQIRAAVGTAITGLTSGASVHTSRVYDLEAGDLPAYKVYSLSESKEFDRKRYPRGAYRKLQIVIEAAAKKTSGLDDQLDTLCAEAEIAIAADITLGGIVKDIYLETTEIELNDGGDQPHGTATMSWIAEYRVLETDPETVLA